MYLAANRWFQCLDWLENDLRSINLYTSMLWNDNDRRLWENIRQSKTRLGSPQMHDVYGLLGWMSVINMLGHRVWSAYRWIYKFWHNLLTKQDSQ